MALAHKGVEARLIPWRFSESEAIAFSNQRLVPILVHDGQVIPASWHIAQHIESSYPDRPALFGDRCPVPLAKFINSWADAALVSDRKSRRLKSSHSCASRIPSSAWKNTPYSQPASVT